MKTLKNLLAPLAVAVVLAMATSASAQVITPRERAVLRHEFRDLRQDLRHFGPTYNANERAILRHEMRDFSRDFYRAIRR